MKVGLLKFMYLYTALVCGALGAAGSFAPDWLSARLALAPDPRLLAVMSSFLLAFAVVAALGLRSPRRFAPVLALQLCFKIIWVLTFVFPHVVGGDFPAAAVPELILFATFILGDLFAVPFGYLFMESGSE
ncbi:MAG TPA: hypothetical protein VLB27_11430 [candidate division Zixibacteria bacterium]|nr:hypothetical protein [candidate division Zixibacteria bacterium]